MEPLLDISIRRSVCKNPNLNLTNQDAAALVHVVDPFIIITTKPPTSASYYYYCHLPERRLSKESRIR